MKKKLLILGGSVYLIPVIAAAHAMGIHVITCDYLPDNLAHPYADEYHNVSIVEKRAVLELASALKIDGVMSFATDPGVTTAAYVAEKLGLPSCGSYEAVSILQNKGLFRAFLRDHGFHTPLARSYIDAATALSDLDGFHWPLIVKPTDSAGSKGIQRVDRPEELDAAIKSALHSSIKKEFIIEEFIEANGYSSDSDCFSVDGKLCFTSFSDQHFDRKAENPYTPSAYSWPCTMSAEQQTELQSELQRLIRLLGLGTSLYNFETRIGMDGTPYIMEVSPRGGGNCLSECLRFATGTDLITAAVKAAIGLPVEVSQTPIDGYWGELILHANQDGAFEGVTVSDETKYNLIRLTPWEKKGAPVFSFTGANKAIGTALFRFDTREELNRLMANPERFVSVRVRP